MLSCSSPPTPTPTVHTPAPLVAYCTRPADRVSSSRLPLPHRPHSSHPRLPPTYRLDSHHPISTSACPRAVSTADDYTRTRFQKYPGDWIRLFLFEDGPTTGFSATFDTFELGHLRSGPLEIGWTRPSALESGIREEDKGKGARATAAWSLEGATVPIFLCAAHRPARPPTPPGGNTSTAVSSSRAHPPRGIHPTRHHPSFLLFLPYRPTLHPAPHLTGDNPLARPQSYARTARLA